MAQTIKIQIKRSTVTASPGTALDIGELAYSYLSSTLYIGGAGGVGNAAIPIAGSGVFATINSPTFTGDPKSPTPAAAADDTSIATTEWVRNLSLSDFLSPNGNINWNGNKITNLAEPTSPQDAATKNYVDMAIQGLDTKASARLKTTANINLSSPGTTATDFDGVTPLAGDRILVTNQTDASQNGIYVYNGPSTSMSRAEDADSDAEVTAGQYIFVEEGNINSDTGWLLITDDPITLDTTDLTYTQFNGVGSITDGAGLSYTGNTLNIGTASTNRIVVNADTIDLAQTGVSAGTYIGFAIDTYGRVTSVSTPTTLNGYGITDAQPLDADLTAIAALTNTGLVVRTGDNTFATRDVIGTANKISVTNGGGETGDIQIDISPDYPGQTSITTLGTVNTGTWQGTAVGLQYGGTNADLTGSATADCLVKINSGGTALEATSQVDGGTF